MSEEVEEMNFLNHTDTDCISVSSNPSSQFNVLENASDIW